MAKYRAVRNFFWKIEDGERINIERGKIYDLKDSEAAEIRQYGLVPYKEEEKKPAEAKK